MEKQYILSAKINELFMNELCKNASDSSLSNEEKETRRLMLSGIFKEVQSIVSIHQEKTNKVGQDLFALANIINKLSS